MQIAQVINASQFTLLGLLLAAVAYVRNIPVKELVESKGKFEAKINEKIEQLNEEFDLASYKELQSILWEYRWNIRFQLLLLNLLQIFISFLSVLIAGRFIRGWGDRFDEFIFFGILFLAFALFLFHLVKDGGFALSGFRAVCRSYEAGKTPNMNKIKRNWKNFRGG
jgi:hypothetical protein